MPFSYGDFYYHIFTRKNRMSTPMKIELGNGTNVSIESYKTLCAAADALLDNKNIPTIHMLILKCLDVNFKMTPIPQWGDPKSILKEYNLLDADDNVHDEIRQLVLSGIQKLNETDLCVAIPYHGDIVDLTIKSVKSNDKL